MYSGNKDWIESKQIPVVTNSEKTFVALDVLIYPLFMFFAVATPLLILYFVCLGLGWCVVKLGIPNAHSSLFENGLGAVFFITITSVLWVPLLKLSFEGYREYFREPLRKKIFQSKGEDEEETRNTLFRRIKK